MKRCASIFAAVLLLSLFAFVPVSSAKETWTRVRSKNFLLVGNAAERDILKVAVRLEQFRDVLTKLLTKSRFDSPVPTTVIVFKSDGAYKPFKPLYGGKPMEVAGYFQSGPDVNYITLTPESRAENPYAIIFHEYTHLLVGNTVTRAPVWFNEGLAEYYSTFDIEDGDKQVLLGKVISNHVFQLRAKFIPLETLFAIDHESPAYNERDKRGIFYAESWALVHYLLLGNKGARQKQLGHFVDLLGSGMAIEESFQKAFQTDLKMMGKELQSYVQRSSYPVLSVKFNQKLEFDAEMQSAEITEAEANAYLGDLLLHINRVDDAEARLRQAIALDENLGMAHASLGMLHARQKKFAEARQHLERAVAADTRNHMAHFYYAYALSREGMGEGQLITEYTTEAAQKMRVELKRAIELAPNFPESYSLLAFVNLVTGEQLDETIPLLRRALALAPSRQDFAFSLAQVYMRKQDFKSARRVLQSIVRNSPDAQLRDRSQSLYDYLASMEEQAARYKSDAAASSIVEDATRKDTKFEDAAQPPTPFKPTLKRRVDGEQVRGTLTRIECAGAGAVLHVKVGERLLKLHNATFENIKFTSYVADAGQEIGCDVRFAPKPVVVIYRAVAKSKFDGEVIVVDFVPEDLKLEK